MEKKEIKKLKVNRKKFKETISTFALVGAIAATSVGFFSATGEAFDKESEINDTKNKEYIEDWEDSQGERWNTSNENSEDFEVEGNGYTGSYHSR